MFNLEGDGLKIAKIKGDKKKSKYIYLDEKNEATNNYKEIKIKEGEIQFIPDIKFRINYIVGASGSGKSYFASKLAEEYKILYPKNPIYLLSYLTDDSSIDRIK